MKKHLLTFLKISVAVSILAYFFYRLGPDKRHDLWISIQTVEVGYLFVALGLLGLGMCLGVIRWQILLRTQGIHVKFYDATWMTATGVFFNVLLPGATGGDVTKAWYISQSAPEFKTRGIVSIAVDRIIGMLGLLLLSSICVLSHLSLLTSEPKTRPLALFILASIPVSLLALLLFSLRHQLTRQSWWASIWKHVPMKALLERLMESYHLYQKHPGAIGITLLISVAVHVIAVFVALLIGMGLHVQDVQLSHYLVYCPIINSITAVPISIGGAGLREGAYLFFFGLQGMPESQCLALSLVFYGTTIVFSLICGVFFLVGKPKSAT